MTGNAAAGRAVGGAADLAATGLAGACLLILAARSLHYMPLDAGILARLPQDGSSPSVWTLMLLNALSLLTAGAALLLRGVARRADGPDGEGGCAGAGGGALRTDGSDWAMLAGLWLIGMAGLVGVAVADDQRLALDSALELVCPLAAGALAGWSLRSAEGPAGRLMGRWLLAAVVGLGAVLAGQSVLEAGVTRPLLREQYPQMREAHWASAGVPLDSPEVALFEARLYGSGAGGFYALPNAASTMVAAGLLACVGLITSGRRRWPGRTDADDTAGRAHVRYRLIRGLLLGLLLGLLAAGVLAGGSRTALALAVILLIPAALLGQLGADVLTRPGVLSRMLWIVAGLLLAGQVLFVAGSLAGWQVPEKSLQFRMDYAAASLRMLSSPQATGQEFAWWTGLGPGQFSSHYHAAKTPNSPETVTSPHHLLLHSLAEYGVVGLAGMLLLCIAPFVVPGGLRRVRSAGESASAAAGAGRLAGAEPAVVWNARWLGLRVRLAGMGLGLGLLVMFLRTIPAGSGRADLGQLVLEGLLPALVLGGGFALVLPSALRADRGLLWLTGLLGLGCILVCNLLDFALFQSGPNCFAALVFAAVVAHRPVAGPAASAAEADARPGSRFRPTAVGLGVLLAVGAGVGPWPVVDGLLRDPHRDHAALEALTDPAMRSLQQALVEDQAGADGRADRPGRLGGMLTPTALAQADQPGAVARLHQRLEQLSREHPRYAPILHMRVDWLVLLVTHAGRDDAEAHARELMAAVLAVRQIRPHDPLQLAELAGRLHDLAGARPGLAAAEELRALAAELAFDAMQLDLGLEAAGERINRLTADQFERCRWVAGLDAAGP